MGSAASMPQTAIQVSTLLAALERVEAATQQDLAGVRAAVAGLNITEIPVERLLQLFVQLWSAMQTLEDHGLECLKKVDPDQGDLLFQPANGLLPRKPDDDFGAAVRDFLSGGDDNAFAGRLRRTTAPVEWLSGWYWTYPTPLTLDLLGLVFRLKQRSEREAETGKWLERSAWRGCLETLEGELKEFGKGDENFEWLDLARNYAHDQETLERKVQARILLKVARALNNHFDVPINEPSEL